MACATRVRTLTRASRQGPITLADYVGLDVVMFVLEGWQKEFPDESAFAVPKILRDKVEAGDLGRKTGKGFYAWNGNKRA